jgi:hypothetical protein
MIYIEIRNASLYAETEATLSILDDSKRRLIEPAIRITHGPIFRAEASLPQKIERPIDLFYLLPPGNVIEPEMRISVASDMHPVTLHAGNLFYRDIQFARERSLVCAHILGKQSSHNFHANRFRKLPLK